MATDPSTRLVVFDEAHELHDYYWTARCGRYRVTIAHIAGDAHFSPWYRPPRGVWLRIGDEALPLLRSAENACEIHARAELAPTPIPPVQGTLV